MNREKLEFRPFQNEGIDRITGEANVYGTDIYEDGHYVGSIKWETPQDLDLLSDEELKETFLENGIIL